MAYDPDEYVQIVSAEDVTDEVLEIAWSAVEGWHLNTPGIDWEDVWDRMDGTSLGPGLGGKRIDMGGQMDTPAMRKIQKEMRKRKREATA